MMICYNAIVFGRNQQSTIADSFQKQEKPRRSILPQHLSRKSTLLTTSF
jgi:hypothetical protein